MTRDEALEALRQLVDLVAADTLGPTTAEDPDEDAVGWKGDGTPLPMTFGHVRRAQEALQSLSTQQPMGEPVAWRLRMVTMGGPGIGRKISYQYDEEPIKGGEPLYVAPTEAGEDGRCDAELDAALKFIQPKLQDLKTEKGLIGVWVHAWRMAWKAASRGGE